jgi:hypothetical protein
MRYIAPLLILFSFVSFLAPSGKLIWVNREAVVAVAEPAACAPTAQSRLLTSNGYICVRESLQEAVDKLIVQPAR